jgi:ribosomal protein L36
LQIENSVVNLKTKEPKKFKIIRREGILKIIAQVNEKHKK